MLREVKNVAFTRQLTLLGWRYRLVIGKRPSTESWRTKRFRALEESQQLQPTPVIVSEGRSYWLFEDRCFWEDEGLGNLDVLALVRDRERRRNRKL